MGYFWKGNIVVFWKAKGDNKMEKELEEWYKLHKFHLYSGKFQTKDLARYLSVNPRTIQRWLKEKSKPSEEQKAQIMKYLNTLVSDEERNP